MNQYKGPRPWFWLRGNEGAGRAVAGVRREASLTQAQLAEQVGMDRTTLLNIEAGRNPAVTRFVEIFGRLGYDLIAVPRGAQVTVRDSP